MNGLIVTCRTLSNIRMTTCRHAESSQKSEACPSPLLHVPEVLSIAVFDDFGSVAMGVFDALGPTKFPHHLIAFGVIDQSLNIQSYPTCFSFHYFKGTSKNSRNSPKRGMTPLDRA